MKPRTPLNSETLVFVSAAQRKRFNIFNDDGAYFAFKDKTGGYCVAVTQFDGKRIITNKNEHLFETPLDDEDESFYSSIDDVSINDITPNPGESDVFIYAYSSKKPKPIIHLGDFLSLDELGEINHCDYYFSS